LTDARLLLLLLLHWLLLKHWLALLARLLGWLWRLLLLLLVVEVTQHREWGGGVVELGCWIFTRRRLGVLIHETSIPNTAHRRRNMLNGRARQRVSTEKDFSAANRAGVATR